MYPKNNNSASSIFSFVLLLSLSVTSSKAEGLIDYEAGSFFRSYALGAAAYGDLGYGQRLYGDSSGVFYGYLRPSSYVISSAIINTIGGQLDFYPISFLGIFGGTSYTWRGNTDELSSVDCQSFYCGGDVSRDYYGVKFVFALGQMFLSFKGREFETKLKESPSREFIDLFGNTVAASGKDTRLELEFATGISLNKEDKLGVSYLSNKMEISNSETSQTILFFKSKFSKKYEYLLGAGQFESESGSKHPTFLGSIIWKGAKGLKL